MILSRQRLPCAGKALQLSGIRFKRLHVSEPGKWANLIVEIDYDPTPELQRKIRSVIAEALGKPELYVSINRGDMKT